MRFSKLLIFIFILLEIFALFCLGVLGDRLAGLINIPTPILLLFTALGIIVAAAISYVRQSQTSSDKEKDITTPPPVYTHLSLGTIWRRLNPHKLRYLENTESIIGWLSFGSAFILGTVGVFFWEPGPGSTYSLFALFSIFITFIPLLVVIVKGNNNDSLIAHAFTSVCMLFLLSAAVTGGMIFGGIVILVLRVLGIHD